jgi:hypothetical protein
MMTTFSAAAVRLPNVAVLGQEGEQLTGRTWAEAVSGGEGQLEGRGPQVGEQDVQVIGVQPRLLGRRREEVLGVTGHELVHGAAGRHQDRRGRLTATSGPTDLLPGRGDRSRVAGQDRHVQTTDVKTELEGVRADDRQYGPVSQPTFDGTAFAG